MNNMNVLIPYYLMMAYRYYEKDDPIVSDSLFDKTAKKLLDNWENVSHRHKSYLNKDMLEAGTFIGQYPSIVPDASYAESNNVFAKRLKAILNK